MATKTANKQAKADTALAARRERLLRNAAFERMSPADKRRALARDALAWVEAGALVPTRGRYLEPTDFDKYRIVSDLRANPYHKLRDKELCDIVLGQCNACAIGALFVAKVATVDRCTVGHWANECFVEADQLTDYFSQNQLALIECAFEGMARGPYKCILRQPQIEACVAFHCEHVDQEACMRAILQRIIDDRDGEFHP